MDLNRYEELSLAAMKRWELAKHAGIDKRILDITSKPLDSMFKKIGGDRLAVVEDALRDAVETMLHTTRYAANSQEIIRRAREHGMGIKDISELKTCSLRTIDKCNLRHIDMHKTTAIAQGAILGLGGPLAGIADLITILMEIFHLSQEIAFCYGFDPNTQLEKEIMLRAIQAGLGNSHMKRKCLDEIALLKQLESQARGPVSEGDIVSVLGAKALAEYVERMMLVVITRLIPQALPYIAVAASAHNNKEMVDQAGKTTLKIYRTRFIERKMAL